ncbi:MAG: thrombospondin type 3 repeat-containing protein [Acidobacteriota bacterium]|nr:MAG: thrombospondin type 3 repeat-containing protein [Acidobacteriota bacterium]
MARLRLVRPWWMILLLVALGVLAPLSLAVAAEFSPVQAPRGHRSTIQKALSERIAALQSPSPSAFAPGIDADVDSDGVEDAVDNCPFTSNSDQADGDGDGLGTACDSFDSGGPLTFGAEVRLPEPDSASSFEHFPLDIGVAPDGTIHILLGTADLSTGAPRNLWLTESSDGGSSWSSPVKVNGHDNVFWFTYADMAIDDSGRIFISYDTSAGAVVLRKSLDGGSSFSTISIAGAGSTAGFNAVAALGGYAYVVWETPTCFPDNLGRIRMRRSTDGGATFEAATDIRGDGSCIPEITIAPSDEHVHLVYADEQVVTFTALSTSTNRGITWGSAVQVRDSDGSGVRLVFPMLIEEGSAGELFTGWVERDGDAGGTNISYFDFYADRSLNNGVSFNTDVVLTQNILNANFDLIPGSEQWDLTTLSNGNSLYVLRDGVQDGRHVYYSRSTDSGASYTQRQPVTPAQSDFNEWFPVITRTASDATLVAFSRFQLSQFLPSVPYFTKSSGEPVEVSGVLWNSKTELAWNASSSSYDITRGDVSSLRSSGNFSGAGVLSCDQVASTVTDLDEPANGAGFYYLVRGREGAVRGTWGTAKRDSEITACN